MPAISLPEKVPEWSSTGVDGNKVTTSSEGDHVTVPGVHCSLATCPQSGQVSVDYKRRFVIFSGYVLNSTVNQN